MAIIMRNVCYDCRPSRIHIQRELQQMVLKYSCVFFPARGRLAGHDALYVHLMVFLEKNNLCLDD